MTTTVIMSGGYRHDTELGPLFLSQSLYDSTLNRIVSEMRRRLLEPNDIVSCRIDDDGISFELREPFSSD
jgi:hypothetical protein